MKYLCLIYLDEKALDAVPERESQALTDRSLDYDDQLRQNGHLVAAHALEPVRTATTLRLRDGKISVTDGPFAETKEQLGGFVLIDARDLNEAIQIASKIPPGCMGAVEVRPIRELARSKEHAS
jgi:hypothetical protein